MKIRWELFHLPLFSGEGEFFIFLDQFVGVFAVFRSIQANFLFFFTHFNRGDLVDQPQSGITEGEGVGGGDDGAEGFEQEERDISMQLAVGAGGVPGQRGEDAGADDTQNTAHPMYSPHVQGIVEVFAVLPEHSQVADHAGQKADDDRTGD